MPGYNDTANDDPKLFDEMARWLADSHTKGIHLNGVVLMQPITNVRVREPEQTLIRLFEKTIGENFFNQITILGVRTIALAGKKSSGATCSPQVPTFSATSTTRSQLSPFCATFYRPIGFYHSLSSFSLNSSATKRIMGITGPTPERG
ncbi:hypothetical protein MCOR20_009503 [Pyricularia oryzae]|nr:hypothetical protein MCOR20_009503 [Pyricularia oryzae]